MPSKKQDEWFSHPSIGLDFEKLLAAADGENEVGVRENIEDAPSQDPLRSERPDRPAAPPRAPSGSGMPILKEGASGAAVENLQSMLNKNGASLDADGQFGPKTTKAVKDFQASRGLAADGVVGPKTWTELSRGGVEPPPKPVETRSVTISAVDEKSNESIVGASVKLGSKSGKTDKSGEVKFTLAAGTYPLIVTAEGFEVARGEVEVTGDEDVHHIELMVSKGGSATERNVTMAAVDEKSADPIAGATVRLGGKSGKTSTSGEVKFKVTAGTHAWSITAEGFEDSRGELEVPPDEDITFLELKVSKSAAATERNVTLAAVDEKTAEPIVGATVKVGGKTGKTSAKGDVKFKLLAGTHSWSVSGEGFEEARGEMEVPPDDDITFLELMVRKSATATERSVTISAVDEKSTKPIVGATVKVGGKSGKTSRSGEVKFTLAVGTHSLTVTAEGFEDARGSLEVTADEDVNHVELMVSKGGGAATERSVTISAVDEKSTKPIVGAMVKVGGKSAKTSRSGEVKFTLPAGTYPLIVTAEGFQEGRGSLEVTADEDVNHVEFLASNAKTGTATFTVSDETDGKVIQGATVEVGNESLETGNIGLAVFVMPPGKYPYRVSAKGFQEARGTVEIELGGSSDILELLAPADSSGSVIFTVADETTGKGIEGADVEIGNNSAKTGNVGFVVYFMPAGTYSYHVTAKGYAEARGTIEVDSDGETRMLELLKPAGASGGVTVVVSDLATGAPIDGAKVEIDAESASTTPGSLGMVTFDGLKPGKHSYRVTADGYANESGTVDVLSDDASPTPSLKVQMKSTKPTPAITLGKLTVEVVFADNGAPAKGAVVTVDPAAVAPAPSVAVCDAKGMADFDGLRPGKCTVNVKTATATGKAVVTITEDQIELTKVVLARAKPPPPPSGFQYEPGEAEGSLNSPGLIEKTPSGFVLFNFGVNKSFIKPEHQKFLNDLIKQLRLDDPGTEKAISVISGFTDGVDVESRNATLRKTRADTVQIFLESHGAAQETVGVIRNTPAGNFLAPNTTRQGRARNRAVTINLASMIVPPVPPPPPPQPKVAKSTKWALQSNLTASVPTKPGVAISTVNFILHDRENRKKFLLQFTGFGGGFGLSFPASVALPAPTDFETTVPVEASDFNGGGAIRQASIGLGLGFSVGDAQLHVTTKPAQVDISGFQFSFGADISFIGGQWKILG